MKRQLLCLLFAISITFIYAQVPCTPPSTVLTDIQIGVDATSTALQNFQNYQSLHPLNFTTEIIGGTTYYIIQDLSVSNTSPTVNDGNCIQIKGFYNVIIRHCYLHDAQNAAIKLTNCHNITITENRIEDVQFGVYAIGTPPYDPQTHASNSYGIKVTGNAIKNLWTLTGNSHAVLFNGVTTPSDNAADQSVVNENKFENVPFHSDPEDIINMYKSAGTADYPICVG